MKEETAEVEAEMTSGDRTAMEEEFGDLLFALVNACRLYGIDPESALERSNKKFMNRFNYMEECASSEGIPCTSCRSTGWKSCGSKPPCGG